jgi:peptidylprolyl isomerase/FKBP-type peptidyl-prolyl cis-trans isomerase FklB
MNKLLRKICLSASLLIIADNGHTGELSALDRIYYYQQGQRAAERIQDGPELSEAEIQQTVQGFTEALNKQAPAYTAAEIRQAVEFHQAQKQEQWETLIRQNLRAGEQYLTSLESKPGYRFLDYGLAYKIEQAGNGAVAQSNSQVKLKYIGRHLNGEEFDRNDTPTWLSMQGVLPGWRLALQNMPAGSHWTLVIPPHLAYGERGAADRIGPQETLIYDLQLLDVQ